MSALPAASSPDAIDLAPSTSDAPVAASEERKHDWAKIWPFVLCHLVPLGAIWSGVTWQAALTCVVLYWVRIWGVTAGYHRYFSHKSFETSRPFAFFLAFLAQSTAQKGAIWWASHHRHHHLYSDQPEDHHSPKQHGFWQAHLGWLYSGTDETDHKRVRDLEQYPELVWLNKHWLVPPVVLGTVVWLLFGWSGLFIGFFLSTVLTWHGTFTINSLCHVIGTRRFETTDTSRNHWFLALITLGEGWHNNHHHWMRSTRQGFYWWELDITYYVLRALSAVGIVWGIKEPPARVLEDGRRRDAERRAAARERREPTSAATSRAT